ncbi:hypothetical protein OH76DRAFT_731430 [Lentinus brumalis]|uniref:Uncharacterized protein n=1 Tax=Lentinus brumalis TaxID=2498619 RepID=A0A371DRZ8_9APHY|nr:hypothetical protein OH76DRAFT_731430 [Polyporus brumalis]
MIVMSRRGLTRLPTAGPRTIASPTAILPTCRPRGRPRGRACIDRKHPPLASASPLLPDRKQFLAVPCAFTTAARSCTQSPSCIFRPPVTTRLQSNRTTAAQRSDGGEPLDDPLLTSPTYFARARCVFRRPWRLRMQMHPCDAAGREIPIEEFILHVVGSP